MANAYHRLMATVENGTVTRAGEWWKRLCWTKRVFWKRERYLARIVAQRDAKPDAS